jgi:tetratricopeptide (TPR) repeat protein
MAFRKILLKLIIVICGCMLGVLILESACYICFGNARECFFKEADTYFDYEPYLKYFKKTTDKNGKFIYITQRSRCEIDSFAVEKSSYTKRIFIAGESAAQVFWRYKDYFKKSLEKEVSGFNFEIVNCATPGYDSQRIRPIMDELAGYEPDMILLFMGNNFSRPLAAEQVFKNKNFRYFYEHSWVLRKLYKRKKPEDGQPYYEVFKDNYQEMILKAKEHKIPVALFVLPVNYKDYPPKENMLDYSNKEYFTACLSMANKEYKNAVLLFNKAANTPKFSKNPSLYFNLGKCYENMQDIQRAKENYIKACDLDAPGQRCDSIRAKIVKELAAENKCVLVDIPKVFEKTAIHGLLGDEIFEDFCHWFGSYNILVANEFLTRVYLYNKEFSAGLLNISSMPKDKVNLSEIKNSAENESGNTLNMRFCDAAKNEFYGADLEGVIYYCRKAYRGGPEIINNLLNTRPKIEKNITNNGCVNDNDCRNGILFAAGEICRRSGDKKTAILFFNRAIKENSKQIYTYLFRGAAFYRLKDKKHAAEDWKIVADRESAFSWLPDLLN